MVIYRWNSVWFRRIFFSFLTLNTAFSPSLTLSQENQKPQIVSLDYCADQYVLALADRDQIKALSMDADQLHSFYRDRAAGLTKFHSTMEEVINFHPDVAVQSWRVTARVRELVNRIGTILIVPPYGKGAETVIENTRLAGKAFAQEKRAKALIADYHTRLKKLQDAPKSRLRAAYVTPSGFTAGLGTFVDEMIGLAGFTSYAASHNLKGWQRLSLEYLVMDPPDIFIASFFDTSLATQSSWSISRHGRLYKMLKDIPTIFLPGRYLSCNSLFLVDAAERIRREAIEKEINKK